MLISARLLLYAVAIGWFTPAEAVALILDFRAGVYIQECLNEAKED